MNAYRPLVRWNLSRMRLRFRDAGALVLSVPKSGRTWFRVMLSKYLALHFDRPLDLDGNSVSAEKSIFYSHELWSHRMEPSLRRRLLGRYICPTQFLRNKPVIVVHRDPRDVLVSLYFHALKRSQRGFNGNISELIRDKHLGAWAVVTTMNAWRERLATNPATLWLGYAELHQRPEERLAAAVRLLGLEPDNAFVREAVAFSRFENMQALERDNALGKRFLSPGNPADPDSFKVRSGKVGGYQEHLLGTDLDFVNEALGELDPFFGYSSTPNTVVRSGSG